MALLDADAFFESIRRRSPTLANRAVSLAIPQILPITRGMGLRVRTLDEESAVVTMPLCARTKNHVGGMYLGALLIVAEVAMAAYMLRRFPPRRFRVLVKALTSENTAQAKSTVEAVCLPSGDTLSALGALDALGENEKGEVSMPISVLTVDDALLVATVTFLVSVKRYGPRADVPPARSA